MAKALTGLVLAGGKSRRFGRDKAGALLAGRPLLEWVTEALAGVCDRVIVVAAPGQPVPESAHREVVFDERSEAGPLAGIEAGLRLAQGGLAFVSAADTPLLVPALVTGLARLLGDFEGVCPVVAGRLQPLCAAYRVEPALEVASRRLDRGELSVTAALDDLRMRYLDEEHIRAFDPDLRSFTDVDTPADLTRIEALLSGG
jgi:molybdopterin-guanine dinucleotide biosynthesis protein A